MQVSTTHHEVVSCEERDVKLSDDILDIVLDLQDCTTLSSCSIVSRSWVVPSQKRLFRSIVFSCDHNERVHPRFLHWLQTHPCQASYIQSLSLGREGNVHDRGPRCSFSISSLWALLTSVPNLRHLSLDPFFVELNPSHIARGSFTLDHLVLRTSEHAHDGTLSILASFSRISHLELKKSMSCFLVPQWLSPGVDPHNIPPLTLTTSHHRLSVQRISTCMDSIQGLPVSFMTLTDVQSISVKDDGYYFRVIIESSHIFHVVEHLLVGSAKNLRFLELHYKDFISFSPRVTRRLVHPFSSCEHILSCAISQFFLSQNLPK